MDKPILWEMMKLIENPAPYFIAVKKIAIRVSKSKVYASDLIIDFLVMCSLLDFITILFRVTVAAIII